MARVTVRRPKPQSKPRASAMARSQVRFWRKAGAQPSSKWSKKFSKSIVGSSGLDAAESPCRAPAHKCLLSAHGKVGSDRYDHGPEFGPASSSWPLDSRSPGRAALRQGLRQGRLDAVLLAAICGGAPHG